MSDPGTLGAGAKTRLESSFAQRSLFKPQFIFIFRPHDFVTEIQELRSRLSTMEKVW